MIYVSNEREVLKMKKVKESVQELYQEKVVTEFHMSLKEGSTIEMHRVSIDCNDEYRR